MKKGVKISGSDFCGGGGLDPVLKHAKPVWIILLFIYLHASTVPLIQLSIINEEWLKVHGLLLLPKRYTKRTVLIYECYHGNYSFLEVWGQPAHVLGVCALNVVGQLVSLSQEIFYANLTTKAHIFVG